MKNYDLKNLKNQCGDDKQFFNEMIELLIRTSNNEILNLERAYLKHDTAKLGYYAHKILSPYRQIQADYLCALLEEVEEKAEKNELTAEDGDHLISEIKLEAKEITDSLGSEYL